jgi:hypothetical protein
VAERNDHGRRVVIASASLAEDASLADAIVHASGGIVAHREAERVAAALLRQMRPAQPRSTCRRTA